MVTRDMLGKLVRKSLPSRLKWTINYAHSRVDEWKLNLNLAQLRRKMWAQEPGSSIRFLNYTVHITDGPNFYMQYKDEFVRRIYHFSARRPDPVIIDGGSNMGMSILCFKQMYPQARIIGFEPDPAIFSLLQKNVTGNGLDNIKLINAGLSAKAGMMHFAVDGSAGGHIASASNSIEVRMERLSDYLDEQVDFLKLNIEGEELPVLEEAATSGKLGNVQEMVIEYHGWPNGEQRLGDILNLLSRESFRYLVHDFDTETCSASKPPFDIKPQTTWFCLVYARRIGLDSVKIND